MQEDSLVLAHLILKSVGSSVESSPDLRLLRGHIRMWAYFRVGSRMATAEKTGLTSCGFLLSTDWTQQ